MKKHKVLLEKYIEKLKKELNVNRDIPNGLTLDLLDDWIAEETGQRMYTNKMLSDAIALYEWLFPSEEYVIGEIDRFFDELTWKLH